MAWAVNDIVIFKAYCFLNSQVSVNTLAYRVAVAAVQPTNLAIANAFSTTMAARIKPAITDAATYRGVIMQKIVPTVEAPVISTSGNGVGTGGANAGPTQTAGIITKRTAFSGRRNRGRVYMPFPDSSSFEALTGNPTAAYKTILQAYAEALLIPGLQWDPPGDGFQLNAIIRQPGIAPNLWPAIIDNTVQSKFGTQKRRGSYGRLNAVPF